MANLWYNMVISSLCNINIADSRIIWVIQEILLNSWRETDPFNNWPVSLCILQNGCCYPMKLPQASFCLRIIVNGGMTSYLNQKGFRTLARFPSNPIVNKSWNLECCGNNMYRISANMMFFFPYLQLKLTLLWRTSISGWLPLF